MIVIIILLKIGFVLRWLFPL